MRSLSPSLRYRRSLFSGCSSTDDSLEGTWRLIYGRYGEGEDVSVYDKSNMISYKILAGTHFAVVSMHLSDSSIVYAGAGTYTQFDDQYEENIHISSSHQNIGRTMAFNINRDGDTWSHSRVRFDEVWKRIK